MIRKILLGAVFAALATPSMAGFNMMCTGPEGVSADIPVAGGVGFSLLGATINVGEDFWTTDLTVSGGTQIVPAQTVNIDDRYYLDFSDPGMESVIAKLRLFWAAGAGEPVIAGTLEIVDVGAYGVVCEFG